MEIAQTLQKPKQVVERSVSPKKTVTPRKADCMSPVPVSKDPDSYLEDTPNKEMMAQLNRPVPSKFDCSKRITRG